MLRYLRIRNLAVIEQAEIEFEPGLNILTGETGAGKSILVEAVSLLLGGRASSDVVRTGAAAAHIEAQFDASGRELVVRREVTSQGRSRAFIDGALASAAALREWADRLIELHGQHEHQVLADAESHLDLLDDFARLRDARARVAESFDRLEALRTELRQLDLGDREKAARVDLLTFQRDEIARAAIRVGEDAELAGTRQMLANAERMQRLGAEAYTTLYEADDAVLSGLTAVWRRVSELAALDRRAAPYLESRDAVKSQLEDLAFFLRSYGEEFEGAPARLQQVEDRLAVLDRLKRKYGNTLPDVQAHHDRCVGELANLDQADARASSVRRALDIARNTFLVQAQQLSAERQGAGVRFERALESTLCELAMPQTRFTVRFDAAPKDESVWSRRGVDRAEFLVSPNPGEELRPLARIASGGELSRVMLAVRTLSIGAGQGRTLIFDEVDAGIGGRAADAVGLKLRALAASAQVLCITHLPQIAACGGTHYRVSKHVREGRTAATVERLEHAARREELARMMVGSAVSAGVLASAGELLASRAANGSESERRAKGESETRKAKGRS